MYNFIMCNLFPTCNSFHSFALIFHSSISNHSGIIIIVTFRTRLHHDYSFKSALCLPEVSARRSRWGRYDLNMHYSYHSSMLAYPFSTEIRVRRVKFNNYSLISNILTILYLWIRSNDIDNDNMKAHNNIYI